ncbi:hypothetical protein C0992_003944 [Termitomyces sp. T32_za158]|nr:hypothetical protein C0992_003944 [Termitomyces sp. T32_za158]
MSTEFPSRSEFWYDDGSIVLVVGDTAFRVHKSILSQHSDVFADLFTVPEPPKGELDFMDGCSVVHLQDDLKDFEQVMQAIYQPFYFDKLPQDADLRKLLGFISGILKISTKYNLAKIRQKCIDILRDKFPTTLYGCDELVSSGYQYNATTVVSAIPLARETNVPEILPWAFYISTNIETDALLADPVLSWRDKALCLAGRSQLWERQKEDTHKFLFDFVKAPDCRHGCSLRLQQMTWRHMEELRKRPHPLHEYDNWDSLGVCTSCLQRVQDQHARGREKVWNDLPKIFHLGTWNEIHQEQNR